MGWSGARATSIRAAIARSLPQPCTKCGRRVEPGQPFDVDHLHARIDGGAVWDPSNLGPAHQHCNRSAGAREGNARRAGRGRRIRPW